MLILNNCGRIIRWFVWKFSRLRERGRNRGKNCISTRDARKKRKKKKEKWKNKRKPWRGFWQRGVQRINVIAETAARDWDSGCDNECKKARNVSGIRRVSSSIYLAFKPPCASPTTRLPRRVSIGHGNSPELSFKNCVYVSLLFLFSLSFSAFLVLHPKRDFLYFNYGQCARTAGN